MKSKFNKSLAVLLVGALIMLFPAISLYADNSPLCFTAKGGSVTVKFRIYNVTHTIQYSTNGTSWQTYTSNTGITINANNKVYFRAATNQTYATAFGAPVGSSKSHFSFSGSSVEASGNIMSLYGPDCPNLQLQPYAFNYMFSGCSTLTKAPELPATLLARSCYMYMFSSCTSLTAAPSLPATTLAPACYENLFRDCSSLTTAPSLPATNLANSCYFLMFFNCSSLKTAPTLPATTLADTCYYGMFDGCTSLTKLPVLPATTLRRECYRTMFFGCTSLVVNRIGPGKKWKIPSTTTSTDALTYMFNQTGGTMNSTPSADTTYYVYSDYNLINAVANNITMGTVIGGGRYYDGDTVTLIATPNEHHHFVGWSNGDTSTTIQFITEGDTLLIANFALDQHTLILITNDSTKGTVSSSGTYDYGKTVTLTANARPMCHFVRWSNGQTSPTMNIKLVSDTSFTAYFDSCSLKIDTVYDKTCNGDKYTGYGLKNIVVTQDTMIVVNTKAKDGCDSTAYIYLTCYPKHHSDIYKSINSGETFLFNGKSYGTKGDYDVTFKNIYGCDSVITIHIEVTGSTTLDNISDINIEVVPNPVNAGATAYIYGDLTDVESVEVLNSVGQVIDSFKPESYPVEVSGISTDGIYFVRLRTTDGKVLIRKLVVK